MLCLYTQYIHLYWSYAPIPAIAQTSSEHSKFVQTVVEQPTATSGAV